MNKILKKILIDRNISMAELAKMANVSPNHLSTVVNGHAPGYEIRERIAKALKVSYDLLWLSENEPTATVKH